MPLRKRRARGTRTIAQARHPSCSGALAPQQTSHQCGGFSRLRRSSLESSWSPQERSDSLSDVEGSTELGFAAEDDALRRRGFAVFSPDFAPSPSLFGEREDLSFISKPASQRWSTRCQRARPAASSQGLSAALRRVHQRFQSRASYEARCLKNQAHYRHTR